MTSSGISLDNEIQYERKLLIPLSFAIAPAFSANGHLSSDQIPLISRNADFLTSDVMLYRLVFNVLTLPTNVIAGSISFVQHLQNTAQENLVRISGLSPKKAPFHVFAEWATGKQLGATPGEFLGYKNRPEVMRHLKQIWKSRTPETEERWAVVKHGVESDLDLSLGGVVILLNGFPAVGKLSVARAFAERFKDTERVRLLDSHMFIDPVQAIAPGRNAEHYRLRRAFQGAAIHGMISQGKKDIVYVIMACLSSSERDVETAGEFARVGRGRNVPFVFVNVICDWGMHAARLEAEDRLPGKTSKTKLTNVDILILRKLVEENRLCSSEDLSSERGDAIIKAVNTTELNIKETVDEILKVVQEGYT